MSLCLGFAVVCVCVSSLCVSCGRAAAGKEAGDTGRDVLVLSLCFVYIYIYILCHCFVYIYICVCVVLFVLLVLSLFGVFPGGPCSTSMFGCHCQCNGLLLLMFVTGK